MVISDFRTEFPEFSDTTKYPDAQITFWSSIAEQQVVLNIWGDLYSFGVKLYTAHEITLAYQAKLTASTGGNPGTFGGIAQSKAVGGVNVSYDTQSTSEKDAGYWNLTNYGKQFLRLARMFGAGGIQL